MLILAREEIVQWGFRVLLADQPWVERCVTVAEADHAVDLAVRYDIHIAVVSVTRLDETAAVLSRRLTDRLRGIRVLFMGADGRLAADRARSAGAVGIVYRDWSADDLLTSVRMAGMGLRLFERSVAATGALSDREHEILDLIADGATNREIASRLFLSPNTVKQNASALYRKLEARNRAEAVHQAQRLGLIA